MNNWYYYQAASLLSDPEGPNAVLAMAREGYKKTNFNLKDVMGMFTFPGFWKMSASYWKVGVDEQYRSMRKSVFLKSLQTLMPEIQMEDLSEPGGGVRAQAVDRNGNLLQDFAISETDNAIHVLSAPSPGDAARPADGQRNSHTRIIEGCLAPWERHSIVARNHDQSVLQQPGFLEGLESLQDRFIELLDSHVVVE